MNMKELPQIRASMVSIRAWRRFTKTPTVEGARL
jgi:hypothetical protein